MKIKLLINYALMACCWLGFSAQALQQEDWQKANRVQTTIPKLTAAPVIDGVINLDEWQQAANANNFVLYRPEVGAKPLYQVEAHYGLDADFLYVAAKIHQPKNTVTDRNISQGTDISAEDFFGVTIDTNYDLLDGYLFQVSPSGVRQEGLVDGSAYIDEWTTIWYAKTQVFDDYWSVEMAIPMQSLSFETDKTTWGLQFRHKLSSPYQLAYWNLNNKEHEPWTVRQVAPVSGFEDLNQGLGIEVKAGVARREMLSDSDWQPSLDISYKFTPNLTGALTLNTDFSGTEVDEVAMVTSRFSVYYPEKRDFFLQDSQIFNFGGLSNGDNRNAIPFYSRSMGQSQQGGTLDLNYGVKLSGQVGDTRLGVLSVNQEQDFQEGDVQLSVARVLHKFDNHHQLGAIVTQGNPNGFSNNQTIGIDYYFDDIVLDDQVFEARLWYQNAERSDMVENDVETKDDKAYGVHLYLPNDKFYLSAKYEYLGEDFQPALGFVSRNGVKKYELNSHYRYRPESGALAEYLNYYQAIFYLSQHNDMQDERISREFRVRPIMLRGKYYDYGSLSFYKQWERLDYSFTLTDKIQFQPGDYEWTFWRIYLSNRTTGSVYGRIILDKGEYFGADYLNVQPTLNYKPNKYLHLVFNHSKRYYEQMGVKDRLSFSSFRANIAFNSEWSWNSLVQHNTRSDSFSFFSRLRYQPAADQLYQLSINKGYDLEEGWHQRRPKYEEKAIKLNMTFRW